MLTLAPVPVTPQITTVDEAKTFYPLFGLGANVALIFSGRAVKYFSNVRACASAVASLTGLMRPSCLAKKAFQQGPI